MTRKKINVLVVDDSALARRVISDVLQKDPTIEVLGAAHDPLFAMERMKRRWPDVIVLDIEMPRMNGLDFLRKIMSEHPTPVIICSSQTQIGATITMQALAAGAVDVIAKPKFGSEDFLTQSAADLIGIVKAAARAKVKNIQLGLHNPAKPPPKLSADAMLSMRRHHAKSTRDLVVAIGASTGGTQSLEVILSVLPAESPPILVVQHMPEKFTTLFAQRLNEICAMEVREAENNDRVSPGTVLIAPGGYHMMLKSHGGGYSVEVVRGPHVNRHCPSVDVLFRSVAIHASDNATGILMTGMGDDGARGLKEMHDAGAHTIAQDEATSVVYGMPREAVQLGATDEILPLQEIASAILSSALSTPLKKTN